MKQVSPALGYVFRQRIANLILRRVVKDVTLRETLQRGKHHNRAKAHVRDYEQTG